MIQTTRAIVLKVIRHGDHTVVLKACTDQLGVRSFIVRIGKKGGITLASLQPLNRLEVVVQEHPERDLLTVRELRLDRPYRNIAFDPVRGALALFVQEVLYKVLRGESADPELYAFLEEALEVMDIGTDIRHFPVAFLVQLSEHLGFRPSAPATGEDRFDLREGEFVRGAADHGHTMSSTLSAHLKALLRVDLATMETLSIPASQRRELLDHLLLYFRMHIDGLGELRSPAVLHAVLG